LSDGYTQIRLDRIHPDRYNSRCVMERYPQYPVIMTQAGFHRLFFERGDGFIFFIIPPGGGCGCEFKLSRNLTCWLVKLVYAHTFQVHSIKSVAHAVEQN